MDVSLWDLLLWGCVVLGGAALVWYAANDDSHLEPKREQALQKRLARYPASARAVIIRGQPASSAWWRPLLNAMLAVGVLYGLFYVMEHGLIFLCGRVGMAETLRWTLAFIFPGVPVLAALPAMFEILRSIRILRGGYAPPLDSTLARDAIAVAGWRAKVRGVAGLAFMAAIVCFTGHLAYDARQAFEAPEKITRLTAECPTRYSSEGGFAR
ncbi:hypothetical protein ASC95_09710 [Pelomonas sp. Root1217]|uniref:hypothetical protein n=1 Tax=Pelomonas sp. Root1217 TaxID=1736430 RepID=UPI00070D2BF3|nr:hypothetical protein [Pelomonas sp. Root1217]KQV53036.1 hypothetical protein ASC95_09710 [Pelomonas sp. Root1217]